MLGKFDEMNISNTDTGLTAPKARILLVSMIVKKEDLLSNYRISSIKKIVNQLDVLKRTDSETKNNWLYKHIEQLWVNAHPDAEYVYKLVTEKSIHDIPDEQRQKTTQQARESISTEANTIPDSKNSGAFSFAGNFTSMGSSGRYTVILVLIEDYKHVWKTWRTVCGAIRSF